VFLIDPPSGFTLQELSTCGNPPDPLCVRVLRATGSQWLAGSSDLLVRAGHVLLIVLLGLLLRWASRRLIHRVTRSTADGRASRHLARLPSVDSSPEAHLRRAARATTVGQVLRSVADVTILCVAGVLVLGELGLNLAPLLASAGIVGVAVGFGAQSLVKDVLAGFFIVMEDQYGVGDQVDIQGQQGVVESVGLRVTRIRDQEGTVWHVRNGEVLLVGNLSQLPRGAAPAPRAPGG
jgi:small-conductance mechanosensitive channel